MMLKLLSALLVVVSSALSLTPAHVDAVKSSPSGSLVTFTTPAETYDYYFDRPFPVAAGSEVRLLVNNQGTPDDVMDDTIDLVLIDPAE